MNANYRDRISITVWAVVMTLAATALFRLPDQGATLPLGQRLFRLPLATAGLVPAWLALLAGTGTEAVVRAHPLVKRGHVRLTIRFWALPLAVTLIAWLAQPLAPNTFYWALGLVLFAALLSAVLAALYFSLDTTAAGYRRARAGLNLACYVIALLLFLLIPANWSQIARSLAQGGVSVLLALELLRGTRSPVSSVALYALAGGAVLAEVAWVLPLTGLGMPASGLLLLLLFYLLVGVAWQSLVDRLTRRVLLEFVGVGLVGLALIFLLTTRGV